MSFAVERGHELAGVPRGEETHAMIHVGDEKQEARGKFGMIFGSWVSVLINSAITIGILSGEHQSKYELATLFAALAIGSGIFAEVARRSGRKKKSQKGSKR